MTVPGEKEATTRERIIAVAMRLFAERGFRGTTVGDIEQAAGLVPRSGALYKHFTSKEELLSAALERHVSEIEAMRSAMEMLPLGDLRAELTLVARWTLVQLEHQQDLMRIVQKDGEKVPELVQQVSERIVNRGYREATALIERLFAEALGEYNAAALAAIALGALVNYRIEQSMFGVRPAGISEEEYIETWVEVWVRVARSAGVDTTGQTVEKVR